jgi:hypothetical protein
MDCDSVRSGGPWALPSGHRPQPIGDWWDRVRLWAHQSWSSSAARTLPVDTGHQSPGSGWLAASTWRLVTDMAFGIFRKPGRWIFSYRFLALDSDACLFLYSSTDVQYCASRSATNLLSVSTLFYAIACPQAITVLRPCLPDGSSLRLDEKLEAR